MIVRGGMRVQSFLSMLSSTIAGKPDNHFYNLPCTRESIEQESNLIYLGAGYWRAKPTWEGETMIGVELENADFTWAERRQVEHGIALLRRWEFV